MHGIHVHVILYTCTSIHAHQEGTVHAEGARTHTQLRQININRDLCTAVNLCQYGAFKKQAINTVPAASIHM